MGDVPTTPFRGRREAVLKQQTAITSMLSDMEAANGYDREDPLSPGSRPQTELLETFKTIIMLCAAGLFVSVLLASYGVDLSPGFF